MAFAAPVPNTRLHRAARAFVGVGLLLFLLPRIAAGAPSARPSVDSARFPGVTGLGGDNYGITVTTLGDLGGDGLSDHAVGAPFEVGPAGATGAVHCTYLTRGAPLPETVLRGDEVNDAFGFSIAGVGDVNGDGYPDLLVGAPFATVGGNAQAGKAFLYLGTASGIETTPAWTFGGDAALNRTGWCVAWAGDVNGDGYNDWLVGAFYRSDGELNEGTAYLFYGGPGPLSPTPAWTYEPNQVGAELGWSLSGAGDVNGDGYGDLIIGAPYAPQGAQPFGEAFLFLGHANKPAATPDASWYGPEAGGLFGYAVGPAGDVNGDGYADFMVGSPTYSGGIQYQGQVTLFYGAPFAAALPQPTPLTNGVASSEFGAAVGTAGDVNGDGFADVMVGAISVQNATNRGAAYVYLGTPVGISTSPYDEIVPDSANVYLGYSVGTPGDTNGDGYNEYWAGAPSNGGQGEVLARPGGPAAPQSTNALVIAQGEHAYDDLGHSLAIADVNGDGYDDVVFGSDYADRGTGNGDGFAALYLGGPNGIPPFAGDPNQVPAPAWELDGESQEALGFAMSAAGDVNGDGYEDVVIGAPSHSGHFAAEGAAYVCYGSPTGLASKPAWRVEGSTLFGELGYSVGGGGDLNGDGYDDVVLGAPNADQGLSGEGLVEVHLGSQFGLSLQPAVVLRGGQAAAEFGNGCAIVGDVNGDGFDDLVVGAPYFVNGQVTGGRVFLYFGSPTGVHAPAAQTLDINVAQAAFGTSIVRIGDVNGDGYADVAVGASYLSNPEASEGKVYVFYGSPTGFVQPAGWTLEDHVANLRLGEVGLGAAGDVDGDGFDDLAVGTFHSALNGADAGRLRVFGGSASGLSTDPIFEVDGANAGDQLGYAVSGAGDFDGDGFSDLCWTAPNATAAFAAGGLADALYGNTPNPLPGRRAGHPVAARRTDGSAAIAPGLWSNSNTAFRLRGHGRSPAGRTRLQLEWEVKPTAVPFATTGHGLSAWQPTGAVVTSLGSSNTMDVTVGGLSVGTGYHWRARYRSASPFFPFTPWLGTHRRSRTERHLATAGAVRPVGVDPGAPGAATLALLPSAPNPFFDRATLAFELPHTGTARLAVYDLAGRLVRALFAGPAGGGRTSVSWDGVDAVGRRVPAGAYFVALSFEGREVHGKIVRLR